MTPDSDGIVLRHLDYLRMRNMRPWTIYNRQRALARLAAWANGPILYLTEQDLRRWQLDRSREIQPEPQRTEMSNVRNFYRWAVRDRYIPVDPTDRLELPRVHRHLPRPISDAALATAMVNAEQHVRIILALAAFAGLRACEIAQLDWSEVGLGQPHPTVRIVDGKGGRGRAVHLSSALATELAALPRRRGPVVPRRDGRAGFTRAHRISSIANEHLHECGISDTLHQCRHRFATTAYQACRDIRAVQEMLGHASPTTTAIYAEASSDVARSAIEAAGALAA